MSRSSIPVGAQFTVTLRVRPDKGIGAWDTETYYVKAESNADAVKKASTHARRDGYRSIDPKPVRVQAYG